MRVGVKFCGNCNPRFDAPELIKSLANIEECKFVRWDDLSGYEVLLVFSSCQVGCATRPSFEGPCIVATSESVQRRPVQEHEIPAALMKLLREFATTE